MQDQGVVGREGAGTGGSIKAAQRTAAKACKQRQISNACNAVQDAVTLNSSSGAGPSAMLAADRTGAGPLALLDPLWLRLPRTALPLPEVPCLGWGAIGLDFCKAYQMDVRKWCKDK